MNSFSWLLKTSSEIWNESSLQRNSLALWTLQTMRWAYHWGNSLHASRDICHLCCHPFSLVQTLGYNPRQRWRLLHKNLEPTSRTCQFSTIHLSATPRVSLACHRFFPTLGCFRGPFSRPLFGLPDHEMDSFSSRTYHNIDWKKTRQFAASCLLFACCTWGLVTYLSVSFLLLYLLWFFVKITVKFLNAMLCWSLLEKLFGPVFMAGTCCDWWSFMASWSGVVCCLSQECIYHHELWGGGFGGPPRLSLVHVHFGAAATPATVPRAPPVWDQPHAEK